MSIFNSYLMLGGAIITEVIGSTFLSQSNGFKKLLPTTMTLICFSIAFFLLAQVVKTIPLGVAYAIWSGVGIILTALVGVFILKQPLDLPALIGIALIVAGVIVMNVFSNSTSH